MSVSFSQIQSASRFSGNSLSSVASTTGTVSFGDFQNSIPSITVGLGTTASSGINISASADLEEGETYFIYAAGLSSLGVILRSAVIRNPDNFNISLSGGSSLSQPSVNTQIASDFYIGSFVAGSSDATVSVTYDDGINNTRSDSNTWSIAIAVDVSVTPTSIFFGTKDTFAIPEQQEFTIFNNASSSVTVDLAIINDPAGAFNLTDHIGPATISGNSSITRTVEFPATSGLPDGIYGGTVSITVDGTQEASVTLSGEIQSGGDDGGFL